MRRAGESPSANRVFYMAVPPSVLPDACRSVGNAGFARCGARDGWARVVVEKPFGHDRASSDALAVELPAGPVRHLPVVRALPLHDNVRGPDYYH